MLLDSTINGDDLNISIQGYWDDIVRCHWRGICANSESTL